jgi:cytochrome c oxidase assembly factor CtaG
VNPALSDAIAASWSFPLWPTLSLLLTAIVYWRGWHVAKVTRAAELPPWRAGCFFAGLAAVWLAIASPLDVLGNWSLFAHMAQHLVLMSLAPPLLLLGAPQCRCCADCRVAGSTRDSGPCSHRVPCMLSHGS